VLSLRLCVSHRDEGELKMKRQAAVRQQATQKRNLHRGAGNRVGRLAIKQEDSILVRGDAGPCTNFWEEGPWGA